MDGPPVYNGFNSELQNVVEKGRRKVKTWSDVGNKHAKSDFCFEAKCQISVFLGVYTHTPPAGGKCKIQGFLVEDSGNNLVLSDLMSCPACSA